MSKSLLGLALAVVCAITAWSCEGMAPSSPSSVTGSTSATVRPFDDPPAPPAAPAPAPAPDPAPAPAPPAPPPPVVTTINIVGTDGPTAYNPNPIVAAVGDTVVFTNGDTRFHHIVLDDGRDVGDVLPGQSTAAVAITSATAVGFHCTVHPSMVGAINGPIPPPPAPAPYEPPYEPDPYYGGYRY